MAKERLALAEEEFKITQRNLEIKRETDKITEATNIRNRKLERAQFITDSFNNVLDSRSAVLKGYGLDFSAEKLDRQRAIQSQQMDFVKYYSNSIIMPRM